MTNDSTRLDTQQGPKPCESNLNDDLVTCVTMGDASSSVVPFKTGTIAEKPTPGNMIQLNELLTVIRKMLEKLNANNLIKCILTRESEYDGMYLEQIAKICATGRY